MPDKTIQLLILPGLGGDHRMAYPQLALPYKFITPDLIEMEEGETIKSYTRRLADHLLETKTIALDRPLFIAGFSFGSAIACELATIFQVRGVILIGGLKSGSELRPLVRFFGKHIVKSLPLFAFRLATPLIRFVMWYNALIPKRDIDLCIAMYRSFSPGLFRNAYASLARWEGVVVATSLLRIHGKHDQIISCPPQARGVVIFADAKHLVHFAKPREVNCSIRNFIDMTMRQTVGDHE